MFPCEQVDGLCATKSEDVVLTVCAISLVSKISNLVYVSLIHQRYTGTDRQTDDNGNTALCTIVHRAVKTVETAVISSCI